VPGAQVSTAVECRYEGQSHEILVPTPADFPDEHERRNGYGRPDTPVEVIAIRATARAASPVGVNDLPAPARDGAEGPAVIAEPDCTIWVAEGWRADPHPVSGALILTRTGR
jgi:5-oxoprolinase (ATP-hydrolysing)